MKGLTDISGVKVGHASNYEALTGVTAILVEGGAVAGGDIRGSATGTAEWDLLNPLHVTPRIHAVVFAGGSAFGLEAASGVRRFLAGKGIGFETAGGVVPLVTSAILYDLTIGQSHVRPTREMGEAAAAAAKDGPVAEGSVGAGTGATVGKTLGMKHAMKGGIGTYTVALQGDYKDVLVSALVAVNAVGDVLEDGKIIAGARTAPDSRQFADSTKLMMTGDRNAFRGQNTTLACIATNAQLSKVQATKVAQMAQHGLVRSISPVHTTSDGDLVIALSCGTLQATTNAIGVAAAEALGHAVVRAIKSTGGYGGVPGWQDWKRGV